MWHNKFCGVLGALGCRFISDLQQWVKDLALPNCGLGHNSCLDLTPGLGTPYDSRWPKRKKKKKKKELVSEVRFSGLFVSGPHLWHREVPRLEAESEL